VLYTLSQLSIEFPEVQETLQVRLKEADLRLPVKPPKVTSSVNAAAGNNSVRVGVVNRSKQ
jgi:hypothetical protein